jgi:hypothetical protein
MRRVAPILLLTIVLLSVAAPVGYAQCAMCRASAEAMDAEKQQALDLAILILLVPTTSIFGGVIFWALRNRNRTREEPFSPDLDGDNGNGHGLAPRQ